MSYPCLCKLNGSLCNRKCGMTSKRLSLCSHKPEQDYLLAAIDHAAYIMRNTPCFSYSADGLPELPNNLTADGMGLREAHSADGLPKLPSNLTADGMGLRQATPVSRLPEPTSNQNPPESTLRIPGAITIPADDDEESGPPSPHPDPQPRPSPPPNPEPEENNTSQPHWKAPGAIANVQTSVGGGNIPAIATETTGGRQTANAQGLLEQEYPVYKCYKCNQRLQTVKRRSGHMTVHSRGTNAGALFPCNQCDRTFSPVWALNPQMESDYKAKCQYCGRLFSTSDIKQHEKACHLNPRNEASRRRKKQGRKKQKSKERSSDESAFTERG
jgi:DNA-directed RNA polymerase subunit RPC12/RpoP